MEALALRRVRDTAARLMSSGIPDLIERPAQLLRKARAVAFDLGQRRAAPVLGVGDHRLDALDLLELLAQGRCHDRVHGQARRLERAVDLVDCGRITREPAPRELEGVFGERIEHLAQSLAGPHPQQVRFEAGQAQNVPGEIHHIADPHVLDDIVGDQDARDLGKSSSYPRASSPRSKVGSPAQLRRRTWVRSAVDVAAGGDVMGPPSFCSRFVLERRDKSRKRNFRAFRSA